MPLENASLRNAHLATRNPRDYSETDWLYAHGIEPGAPAVPSTPTRNEDR
jgi:hypothetical protein